MRLRDRLGEGKTAIPLALTILIILVLAATAYYYYGQSNYYQGQSNDRAAQLSQKETDYDALNASYYDLSSEHAALKVSHANLTERYNNLSSFYDHLASNESSLRSDYESLNASVGRLQEKGGPVIAVYYKTHKGGTKDEPQIIVDATAYNVGDRTADRVTIKCKVIYEGQPDLNDVTFTNVAPLDKRSYSWNFSILADVDSVWAE